LTWIGSSRWRDCHAQEVGDRTARGSRRVLNPKTRLRALVRLGRRDVLALNVIEPSVIS